MVPRSGGRSVLLVEDNPGDARLIAEFLRDADSTVRLTGVETLAEALDTLVSTAIDAVILDLGLPDSQGIETFTRLQAAAPRVATIVLSGDSDTEVALKTVQEGAQDFLVKGHIDGDTLIRCIGYAIERERVEWSLRESEERLRDSLQAAEAVAGLSRALVSENRPLEDIAQMTLSSAMALTSSPQGYVSLVVPVTGEHSLVAATDMMRGGLSGADAAARAWLSVSADGTYPHLWGVSLNTGEPFMTNEPSADPRSGGTPDGHEPLTCLLTVPVVTSDRVVGQVSVANAPDGYSQTDTDTIQRLASVYGMAIVQHEEQDELRRSESELRASNAQLERMILDVAEVMGGIIETRDPYTQGHQVRVAAIATALATEMGLEQDDLDCIRMAALLHDVGKLSVPAEILSKPGTLSEIEFSLIKEHSTRGQDILRKIDFPWPIADIVLQHHERCDGSGYPNGLRGDQTLLPAKIIAVADVLEAMSSYRPYRAALGAEAAIDEIVGNPDKYCPEVVSAVVALNNRSELGL